MRKIAYKLIFSGLCIIAINTGIRYSYKKYEYWSENRTYVLNVVNKVEEGIAGKYHVYTNFLLIFEDSTGMYKDIKVSPGTYMQVIPPRRVAFRLSRDEYHIINTGQSNLGPCLLDLIAEVLLLIIFSVIFITLGVEWFQSYWGKKE